ncbi:MAG: MBL fold metallo-hydrolase [Deltaproteobacteria bacterium]|nr:MBL fold metallo-hydrolase [Deltaproteobacteria bacterium]
MKIRFMGAARTVTGSCFLLDAGGVRFAVDCGMHQGNKEIESRNLNRTEFFDPTELSFILMTHAHIDHSGLLPKMVREGFSNPVYTTEPTRDLLEIMLADSAHIQEMEARWENNRRAKHGKAPVEPLYDQEDAMRAVALLKSVSYYETFEPAPGIKVKFNDAGHILGSAFIEIWVDEDGKSTKLIFTGDLGRPDQLLIRDPNIAVNADFLFMESTYGARDHKNESLSRDELAEAIAYSYKHGQKVIIPAFAVERSQEVIYCLRLLAKEGRLPPDVPIFLDSPLAIRATEIFRKHWSVFDRESRSVLEKGEDPLDLPNLRFTLTTEESMAINSTPGTAVIISASGMANAGRIKHHLRHNIWKKGASIVFVGFQAMGTPGRKIVDGAREIRILGEQLAVEAKVFTINGFSAHAGQSQLMAWLSHFRNPGMKIFLVHGEYDSQQVLADLIRSRHGYDVHIPDYLEECELEADRVVAVTVPKEKARPGIDWIYLTDETRAKADLLVRRLSTVHQLPWYQQTEIRDNLVNINSRLASLISDIYHQAGPMELARDETEDRQEE